MLPDMVELRTLTPDDWRTWRQVRLAALAQAPYAFGSRLADWQGDGDREQRWRARLERPGIHLVALRDAEPVGMVAGEPTDRPGVVELISMWVDPRVRGAGVGDRLMVAVEQWARRQGATEVELAVAEGNHAAWRLYRRNGFREAAGPATLMPDGVRREYVLTKVISR